MATNNGQTQRRRGVIVNVACLIIMNACFYLVSEGRPMSHIVDAIGLLALLGVAITFYLVHIRTGLWRLTHRTGEELDERELMITHQALSRSYAWFTVICLVILLVHAVLYRLVPGIDFIITVPLVGSLIYLAHTFPGMFLAWTEGETPGEAR